MKRIFASLQHSRNFRLFFTGDVISLCGVWMQTIALSWLVYRLTHSMVLLTTVYFLNQIPSLLFMPVAGVLCDRISRYKVLVTVQALMMLQSGILAALTFTGVITTTHILCLSAFSGILTSFEMPARQAFFSDLVDAKDLPNAVSLNMIRNNIPRFIGSIIGGYMMALKFSIGEGWCFLINAASYIAILLTMFMMRLPKFQKKPVAFNFWRQTKEAFTYVRNFPPIRTIILFVVMINFFAMPFMSIISALVKDNLRGNSILVRNINALLIQMGMKGLALDNKSILLGYFNALLGAGALAVGSYLAARKHTKGLDKMLPITMLGIGVSIILLSFIRDPDAACLVAFIVGFSLIGFMAASNILVQTLTDNNMRGRVMSFFTMSFAGFAALGALAWGYFAKASSLSTLLLAAGSICLLIAIVYGYYRFAKNRQSPPEMP